MTYPALTRGANFWRAYGASAQPAPAKLLVPVHWLSWSLQSECSPTTNSKRKAWGARL